MPGALTEATCASQARIHYRGQIIFGQDSVVKGLYVLRHGSANMQHVQMVQEAELRFPGRDDLMMEEELEYKIKDVERKVPLGDSREGAVFGEELAGHLPIKGGAAGGATPGAIHAYSLCAESTVVIFFIPWQGYQERLEEAKSKTSAARTLQAFAHNKRNRAAYLETHLRYFRGSRFFVDLARYKHLTPNAYLKAAHAVQRFLDLYKAIICSDPGQQVQHSDVQAAEAAANKSAESLDCISRATKTPSQTKELKRLIGSMVEEMRQMLQEIRTVFQGQMQKKLEQGQAQVRSPILRPAVTSPERDGLVEP
jgi:hypothetical protein